MALVAGCKANQRPVTVTGSVCRKVASWWHSTSPPTKGGLADHHALHRSGSGEAEGTDERRETPILGKGQKAGIQRMQRVTNLVDRHRLVAGQPSLDVEGAGLEKKRILSPDSRK